MKPRSTTFLRKQLSLITKYVSILCLLLVLSGCKGLSAVPGAASDALTTMEPPPSSTASPTPTSDEIQTPTADPISPSSAPSIAPSTPAPTDFLPEGSSFEVHFIDVGQADAALVLCDGHAMVIDGGNPSDSSLMYTYLKDRGISQLDYMVMTHPHDDHGGGLPGALNYATVTVAAFAPMSSYPNTVFENYAKYLDEQGMPITVPTPGEQYAFGSSTITVLGPIRESTDLNNMSIVLRIDYGSTSFLFTGDAEYDEEQDIIAHGENLKCTVLKVGHHGSDTSNTYSFLLDVMPDYSVISVGATNNYGHPTEAVLSRLRDAGSKVYRTDLQGDIICSSDGVSVSFTVEKNPDADTLAPPSPAVTAPPVVVPGDSANSGEETEQEYILNTNTHKFHYPSCHSVDEMKDANKQSYTGKREDLIAQGYSPCGRCHP